MPPHGPRPPLSPLFVAPSPASPCRGGTDSYVFFSIGVPDGGALAIIEAMHEPMIEQHFVESADLAYQAAPLLARPVQEAAQLLVGTLTAGGKLLAAGDGPTTALTGYVAARLVSRLERERPGLAALALGADAVLRATLSAASDPAQTLARQIEALGQPGDALLLLSPGGQGAAVLGAVQAAHERDMSIIAITGQSGAELARLLRETDVHLAAPHTRELRVIELMLLLLHCLCECVDDQLLGEAEGQP